MNDPKPGVAIKSLFVRRSISGYVLAGLCVASGALVAVDGGTTTLKPLRGALTAGVFPLYYVAESPYLLGNRMDHLFSTHARLRDDVDRLETELVELRRTAGLYQGLVAENDRLRALLGSTESLPEGVLVAEIIAILPNPARHEVVIDKGLGDSVSTGQAVVDSGGLFGQVVQSAASTSRVLLISDTTHAVPVHVNRSNLRSIAAGTGAFDRLTLESVPIASDIVPGDLLVSSGLGGRFPFGYPVGVVQSVVRDPGDDFARVEAMPSAALDRSRHVLVVREGDA
ncbi:MAG: rod shape-determining protein MreC [Gammaproteobacteria bacterium]|nr:rod shape-determining protein MreC [Gammaproteobacteria bacterium]